MGGEDDDGGYSALAPSAQRRIDDAFDSTALSSRPSSRRRNLDHDHPSPRPHPASILSVTISNQALSGGFLLDNPSPAAGGFLHDDSTSAPPGCFLPDLSISQHSDPGQDGAPTHIPLFLIPTALHILDLQPDDDVLSVFHNAASGWTREPTSNDSQDDLVSRRDWRAVCAALLDTDLAQDDVDGALSSTSDAVTTSIEEPSDSGEEYVQPGSDWDMEEDQGSDDDYHEGGFLRTKRSAIKNTSGAVSKSSRGRGRKPGAVSSEDGNEKSETEGGLNAQQKKECRAVFALFFPDARDESLDKARIQTKDITRVAALIKEKLSTEEVSASPLCEFPC